jgi:tetratricopeptide (TPR) repeat protein
LDFFDKSIELKPGYFKAWCYKGMAFGYLERHDEALECFEQVVTLKPENAHGWSGKALTLEKLGRPEEALKCYQKSLELNPNSQFTKNAIEHILSMKS